MRIDPVHYWAAGIEIRPNICTAIGDEIPPHVHDHPHLMLIERGRWAMRRGLSRESCLAAQPEPIGSAAATGAAVSARIEVPAGMWHAFKVAGLENGCASLVCLWAGGVS